MTRHGSVRRRGGPLPVLLLGTFVFVAALAVVRGAPGGPETAASPAPDVGAPGPTGVLGLLPSLGALPALPVGAKPLPAGLVDRGWVAEVAVQRWIAGTLSGRLLVLPADETALTATATTVVSVRYNAGGATSTVRVREFGGVRLRLSLDRPGTVSSAVVSGATVYLAGDDGSGTTDAGVQAVSLADGSVTDLIAPGPAPADAIVPITRGQLRLSASGRTLASPLCSGDTCSVDLIDLTSGGRRTVGQRPDGLLLGLTDDVLFLADEPSTSVRALEIASGAVRWSLADAQINGVIPSADGSRAVIGYVPNRRDASPSTFTLATADAASGSLKVLLQQAADADAITFFPGLSSDRYAVIGRGGSLSDVLGGIRHRIALTLIDAGTGRVTDDAVTLTAP